MKNKVSQKNGERYRSIFENAAVAVAVVGLDGKVIEANDADCRFLGYPRNELIGMHYRQFTHPDDIALDEDLYRSLIEGRRKSYEIEKRYIRSDRQVVWGRLSVSMIRDGQGRPAYTLIVCVDITERKRAEAELKKSREKLRALSARLQSVREEERGKIAREIHDDLGQQLTGLKMDLGWLLRHFNPDQLELLKKARAMSRLIDRTVKTVRRISTELRPRILDDFGLVAALEWQAQEFSEKTGIVCRFRSTLKKLDLEPDLSAAIFRIFQEALTNVARHSQATLVTASIKKDQGLILNVCDNGRGISGEEIDRTHSLGLMGMRERALLFGGTVIIEGRERKGTSVTLYLPDF